MAKRHNRKNQQRRGPQLSDGERLWKRMSTAIGDNEELWNKSWNAQTIAELLITAENARRDLLRNQKLNVYFVPNLTSHWAAIRRDRQFFTSDARKTITMRKLAEIEGIKASIADWEAFFLRHGKAGELFQGPPEFDEQSDKSRYEIIENAWLAMLNGHELPETLSLGSEGLTKWGRFDLVREISKFADIRCGFRFQESTPSIALLLLQNQRFTVNELLDLRLAAENVRGVIHFPDTMMKNSSSTVICKPR